jgi:hypothetical protein
MNLFRKSITLLGSIVLLALILAALAPRTARGVAAALVQITNTTSTPVPTSDVSPLQPFVQTCIGVGPGYAVTGVDCQFSIPTGQRLVVETASMLVLTSSGVVVSNAGVSTMKPGLAEVFVPVVFTSSVNGINLHTGSQAMRLYADSSLSCDTRVSVPDPNIEMDCFVSGYLVSTP